MLAVFKTKLPVMWKFWQKKQNDQPNRLNPPSGISVESTADMDVILEATENTQSQELLQQANRCLEQFPEQALELLQQGIALTPNMSQLWEKKGLALQNLGRIEEAIAANQQAMQLLNNGMGNSVLASDDLGQKVVEQSDTFENFAVSLPAKAVSQPPQQRADDYFEQGNQLYMAGHYEEAIASYDKAIEFKPDFHGAWSNRGNSLANLGRYDEAIASYDKAIELKPDLHQAWFNRGVSLANLGRDDEAIASNDKAIEFKPDDHEAWYNRGVSLDNLGRYEEAIASYDKAIEFKPDDHQAWSNRGTSLANLGRYEEAIASYDKAIEFKPDFHGAWHNRGVSLANLGRDDEAIASNDKAIEFKPDDHEAWYNRGVSLDNLGRYEEAIASYDKAIEFKPDLHQAWIGRGFAALNAHSKNPLFSPSPSVLTLQHPELNQRFYPGQCISLEVGLTQVAENSEAWGRLHQALGNAHYRQGQRVTQDRQNPTPFWHQAQASHDQALSLFTPEAYPEARLEVLQDLFPVLLALKQVEAAQSLRQESLELYRNLLNELPTTAQKQRFETKFSGLSQLAIDLLLQEGQPILALEAAERYKNRCLTQILDTWQEHVTSPSYADMRQLLTQPSAIIYWHLSLESLTTFILTPEKDNPIILTHSASFFKTWQRQWDQPYNDYRLTGKDQTPEKINHPWRSTLKSALAQLKTILQIEHIETLLPTDSPLILIPHRDLHRFPLHTLFTHRACRYLPSLQVGLSQQPQSPADFLLNIHDPHRPDQAELEFAALESALLEAMLTPSVKTISRNDANLETVKSALQNHHGIFHFTGHSEYQPAKPENSALGLAHQDLLTAKDIATLNLKNYHLVCLSACETALTGTQTIERDYVGLASAFLQAGVSQVIGTCWTVPEISSTFLMIRFYQFLQHQDASKALQQAQLWLSQVTAIKLANWLDELIQTYEKSLDPLIIQEIQHHAYLFRNDENATTMDSHSPPFADPYHWAAFTLSGRGSR